MPELHTLDIYGREDEKRVGRFHLLLCNDSFLAVSIKISFYVVHS